MDIFLYKYDLVKCSCPIFCRDKKKTFVKPNANILQSLQWKFLNFISHLFKQVYYNTLQLHVSQKKNSLKLVLVLEMAILEHFQ